MNAFIDNFATSGAAGCTQSFQELILSQPLSPHVNFQRLMTQEKFQGLRTSRAPSIPLFYLSLLISLSFGCLPRLLRSNRNKVHPKGEMRERRDGCEFRRENPVGNSLTPVGFRPPVADGTPDGILGGVSVQRGNLPLNKSLRGAASWTRGQHLTRFVWSGKGFLPRLTHPSTLPASLNVVRAREPQRCLPLAHDIVGGECNGVL